MWSGLVGFFKGLGQGGVNILNGLQDTVIGILNIPAMFFNGIVWIEEKFGILSDQPGHQMPRIPYIPSPDWSRDLVTHESGTGWADTHNWSKILGAGGVEFLTGLWWAKLVKGKQAASLVDEGASLADDAARTGLNIHKGSGLLRAKHNLAIDVVTGRKSRLELLKELSGQEINQMANFFRQQANRINPKLKFKNAARKFNLERARYLEQGGPQAPGNLLDFIKRHGLTN